MDEVANIVVGNTVMDAASHEQAFHTWADCARTGARILQARLTALNTTGVGFNRRFACTCVYVSCCKELGWVDRGEMACQELGPESRGWVVGPTLHHWGFNAGGS